ncbi:hypothetical protein OG241_12315 [Streptomyces sp. NBC_01390]|uniref:hypothetical protein n=1 Tax=Streptomyces sp. NBC_01390 TaxID=2903850 RepID=UPI0032548A37
MATFLYRLGRLAFRRRRLFLMFWIVVLAAVGIGAAGVSGKTTDEKGGAAGGERLRALQRRPGQ